MGKSLNNVVTPDEMCERYGADTFRMYEMGMGPMDMSRPWQTRDVVGSQRYLQRLWRLVVLESTGDDHRCPTPSRTCETQRLLHRTIDGVSRRLRRDGLQHRDRQVDRADQPPDQVRPRRCRGRWPRRWC